MHLQEDGIEDYEEIMGSRDFDYRPKLHFNSKSPNWTTEEDLRMYGAEGRSWAELIFEVILHLAKKHSRVMGSYVDNKKKFVTLGPSRLYDVVHTCETCLERLRSDVFFADNSSLVPSQYVTAEADQVSFIDLVFLL